MKLISGIVDSGFFAQSALSAEIATKDNLGRNISETYLTGVDLTPYQTTAGMTAYANSAEVTGTAQYGLTTAGWSEITGGGVTGDYELKEGNGIQLTDDPIAQTTTISVSGDYATNTQLQTVSGEITAMIPSTAGLATQDWVTGQGYITGVDLTPYQTTAGMTAYLTTGDSANFYTTANESGFITGVDLTPYQLTADMTAYQPVGSYLTADALDSVSGDWNEVSAKLDTTAFSDVSGTFLTAHQDISNKLDTTAFSDVSGSFLTAVPDTYLQNTDLSTEDGKVTAISGIPLSAGGDVPEGVMVESGLEYNAVQEISGYNGSAIAQYGAEKQWLQHDDTLVHAANSAQYALGVNLSAVAQLLGVDETVLWEGPVGSFSAFNQSARMNDSITNFREVALYNNMNGQISKSQVSATEGYASFFWNYVWYPERSDCNYRLCWTVLHFSGDVVKTYKAKMMYTVSESTAWQNFYNNEWSYKPMIKIVGIGRKEV